MASTYELIVQATDKASKPLRDVEKGLTGIEKQTKAVNTALKAAGGAILAFATGSALRGIVQQYTAFERYRTVLATYLGSQEKANAALKDLQVLANNLPQDLDDITQAFVTLNRFGIDTSAKSLTAFSNIATANGKSLTQLAEAVADGMAGEYERFKEFGIKVTNESGKLTAAIGNDIVATATNSTDLINQLQKLGETRFGDAAANNADTLGQSLSNLKGAITEAVIAFAEGLAPALKESADQAARFLRTNQELVKSLGAGTGEAIRVVANAAQLLANSWDLINTAIWTFLGLKSLDYFSRLGGRMIKFTNGAKTASGVMSGLTKAITATGTAAVVAAGQFTGITSAMAILSTTAGKLASGLGLLFASTNLNEGELTDPIYTTTNAINAATEAMKNFAGTREELDALIAKNQEVVDTTMALANAQDLTNSNGSYIYNNLTESVMLYNGALYEAAQRTQEHGSAVAGVVTGMNDFNKRMQEVYKQTEENIAVQKFAGEALQFLKEMYDEGTISLQYYTEAKKIVTAMTEKAAAATQKELTFLQQLVKTRKEQIDNTLDIQRALSGENDQVQALAKQYGISEAEVRSALQDRLASLVEVRDVTTDLGEKSKTAAEVMQDSFKQATEALGNNIARGLAQGKFALDDFKSFFDSFLEDILTAIIQKNITGPLVEQLTGGTGGGGGLLGSLVSGISGLVGGGSSFVGPPAPSSGGFFSSLTSGISSFFGGFFANGGMPPVGKPSIVGEAGPEIFVPKSAGTIIPNNQLNSGGGQPVVVNFNINAIDTQTGVEFIVEQKDTISAVVSDALNKRGRMGIVG